MSIESKVMIKIVLIGFFGILAWGSIIVFMGLSSQGHVGEIYDYLGWVIAVSVLALIVMFLFRDKKPFNTCLVKI